MKYYARHAEHLEVTMKVDAISETALSASPLNLVLRGCKAFSPSATRYVTE